MDRLTYSGDQDERFYIAKSNIPNAGMGLFAKIPITKGESLEVLGPEVQANSLADLCSAFANSYKFYSREDKSALVIPVGYAGMVNHALNRVGQNTQMDYSEGKVRLVFIQNVAPMQEILHYYGDRRNLEIYLDSNPESFDEWQKFISWDLYNLGFLQKI